MSLSTNRQNLKIQAVKNAATSWLSLAANLVLGFFMAPFILHHLGDEAFGIWILIFSITGYYGLFDFGIRSSIIKYVAEFAARNELEALTRFINTCLFVYSCIAVFLIIVTAICSQYASGIFHIAPTFTVTVRLLVLAVGASIALGFPLGVFAGILEGLQQYTWENVTQIASSLLRAGLIVIALQRGRGLVTITFITIIVPLLASTSHILIVRRVLPIAFGRKYIDRAAFHRMRRYGVTTFISMVAGQLRYRTDAAVIGMFLSSTAITFFSIGSKLVDYSRAVVDALASVFAPMSSHLDARGDLEGLRRILILGNRACAMIAFPICVGAILLGKSLICVWVGPKYLSSFPVLVLLIVPQALDLAQATSPRILYGMNQHQVLSLARIIEGFANLALSIAFVQLYGVIGVALGTAIPFLCMSLLFLPIHVSRRLSVPLFQYLRQAYLPPLLLCVPMTLTLLLLQHLFQANSYLRLFLQVLVGATVYGAGAVWFMATRDPIGGHLTSRFTMFLRQALSRYH